MSILDRWRADRAYARAWRLARAGETAEAAKLFGELAGTYGERALIQKARVLGSAGRTGEAVKAAQEAAHRGQRNPAAWLVLGQAQYDAGNLEEARAAFAKAHELEPGNLLVQAGLGLTRLAQGQVEAGAELLRPSLPYGYEWLEARVIALAEQRLWESRARAKSLEEQLTRDEGARDTGPAGLWTRVASALRRGLLGPLARLRGPVATHLLRAQEAMSIGDAETAIVALQAAEKVGARAEDVTVGLAQASFHAGRAEAAAAFLARLPEELRREPDLAALSGEALFEAGRYEEARTYLSIAAERFRQEFVPVYYRGLCEIALGRPRQSVKWFEETAARLNPHVAAKRLDEMLRVRREAGDSDKRQK